MDTALWTVLADPSRRTILGRLLTGPCPVGELAEACGLSQPNASKHLRVLREAGLVSVQPEAQRRLYVLEPAPMAELDAWLAPYRHLWNSGLDRLGRRLDALADERMAQQDFAAGPAANGPKEPGRGSPQRRANRPEEPAGDAARTQDKDTVTYEEGADQS